MAKPSAPSGTRRSRAWRPHQTSPRAELGQRMQRPEVQRARQKRTRRAQRARVLTPLGRETLYLTGQDATGQTEKKGNKGLRRRQSPGSPDRRRPRGASERQREGESASMTARCKKNRTFFFCRLCRCKGGDGERAGRCRTPQNVKKQRGRGRKPHRKRRKPGALN